MAMKLIVGLGNPGSDYKNTKHNAGFWIIQAVAKDLSISFSKRKFNALIGQGKIKNNSFLLVKPLTYMNLSGKSVRNFADYFKIDLKDILVVFDDVSLELGTIRMRKSGSAGGHNGLKSIIGHMGSSNIARLRFGIKVKENGERDLSRYVLSGFNSQDDKNLAGKTVEIAKQAVISWLKHDIDYAMNRFNSKRRENPENE
jgi:PTH1 family peptidyl-tRNA hydrolase